MYWDALPTSVKRALRQLAGIAYQRELDVRLRRLHEAFGDWNAGTGSTALAEKLRRASVEIERELAREYKYNANVDKAVARAIARGVIHDEEIPDAATAHLFRLLSEQTTVRK